MNPNEARMKEHEEAEEAKRWVESIASGECLHHLGEVVVMYGAMEREGMVYLDGEFKPATLRALADYMEQHTKEGK